MTNGDRQQESLEVLKLINAAYTSLRLYPADSAQVRNTIENAYQGVKSFIRKNGLFHFSCHDGAFQLVGVSVDKTIQERLKLLSITDVLQKMEFGDFVLYKGFDRAKFKKILSVFGVTPEQVKKAGGNRLFIDQLDLSDVFPEEYIAPGQSKEELERKQVTDQVLKELAGTIARPEDLHYLFGKKEGKALRLTITAKFKTAESAARLIATASYSLLQILQKNNTVTASPAFGKMLERVTSLIEEAGSANQEECARKAAALLSPLLDDSSAMMLICQQFPYPFGPLFYESVIKAMDGECLNRVYTWMKNQHEKKEASPSTATPQRRVVSSGYEHFMNTPRAKQILAAGTARELLAKTEESRKTQRVQTGINALAAGNMTSLGNKEVCNSLPSTISKLLKNGKESLAAAIIQNVVSGLKNEKSEFHSSFVAIVGGMAEKLVLLERWDWLEKLTPVCLARIQEAEVLDSSFKQYVQAMQAMMNHAWHMGNNDLAEGILDLYYNIRSGALGKAEELHAVIAQVQDKNVDLARLQTYLDQCFVRPVDERLCKVIIKQGPVATRFLVDTLIGTEERSDRIRLLKLLSEVGGDLVPVLLESLPNPMPWYGKRNIIRLLAETGSSKDAEAVLEYMLHEDIRVQEETLHCITRIGKEATNQYLLKVLPDVSLLMQVQLVKHLGRTADESVVEPLAGLLDDCKMYHGKEKKMLAEVICRTLGESGSEKGIPVLQEIIDGSPKLFGAGAVEAAKNAINSIRKRGAIVLPPRKTLVEKAKFSQPKKRIQKTESKPKRAGTQYVCVTSSPEEQEVYDLLGQDKLESAKKVLLNLLEKSAKQKQFDDAEALRMRLIEIDPMALAEIIKAAEFIEDAKAEGVDKDHVLIWSELYDLLTTEEFNDFYHNLQHETYSVDTDIVAQGDPPSLLYFVNKGRVKLYYQEKGNEILVKTLGGGQVFGGDSFFNDSVWTLSATSMGSAEISTLSMATVERWKDTYPALEMKIRDYCLRFNTENEFFVSSGADRRNDKRNEFSDTVYLDLLDEEGNKTDTTLRGTGSDLSRGGISFLARINRRKHARILLGRSVSIRFGEDIAVGEKGEVRGRVVAVRNLHSIDLGRSVHVRFDRELERTELSKLLGKT
jgi:CRP-like cAMP-binding protein